MTAAGEGYRFVIGVIVLMIHVIAVFGGLILVALRREYQPAKINSPFLMILLTLHMVPMAVLVPIREMGLLPNLTCEAVSWLTVSATVWACAPQGTIPIRLLLAQRFEQRKVAFANNLLHDLQTNEQRELQVCLSVRPPSRPLPPVVRL